MVGDIRRGLGWRPRRDDKYQDLICVWTSSVLPTLTTSDVGRQRREQTTTPTSCWRSSWRSHAWAGTRHTRCGRHGRAGGAASKGRFAATSFAILHENSKVKRTSPHVTPWETSTAMMRRLAGEGGEIHVFGHDLLNANRQWPVRHASHNSTFLQTVYGLTLWFHLAMWFAAAASVFNFNRVGRFAAPHSDAAASGGGPLWTTSTTSSTPSTPTRPSTHSSMRWACA